MSKIVDAKNVSTMDTLFNYEQFNKWENITKLLRNAPQESKIINLKKGRNL